MRAILFVLILVFPAIGFGLDCESPEVVVYFGNGMFNNRDDAHQSQLALEKSLIQNTIISADDSVHLAYNLNESVLEELLQVATQKGEEYGRSFFRWLSNLSLAPMDFRTLASEVARNYDEARYLRDPDLKMHVDAYRSEIRSGHTILVVPHSQGNFYANSAWHLLNSSSETAGRFFIVSAAAPVNAIAGRGPYITLSRDIVIHAVRSNTGALPANTTNSSSSFSGHEFVSQYLKGDQSGPKIISDLRAVIDQINHVFSTPGTEGLAYHHRSLWPFMRYACAIKKQSAKLTDAHCVALSAFAKTYDLFGVEKAQRDLTSITRWIDGCEKDSWHNPNRSDFNECTLLG